LFHPSNDVLKVGEELFVEVKTTWLDLNEFGHEVLGGVQISKDEIMWCLWHEKRAMQAGGYGFAQPWSYQDENSWGRGYGYPYM